MSVIAAAGTPAPSFKLGARGRRELHRAGPAGPHERARVLPVRIQPRVHRPAAAVRGRAPRAGPGRGDALYGVSCDSSWAQKAFREKLGVSSAQLSDFEPKGAACAAFGVLHRGRLPAARTCDHRPRRHRSLELSVALAGRSAPGELIRGGLRAPATMALPRPAPRSALRHIATFCSAPRSRGAARHSAKLSCVRIKSKRKRIRRPTGGAGRQ